MSLEEELDQMEDRLEEQREEYPISEEAKKVEEYFESFEDAKKFAKTYDSVYERRHPCYDPKAYAEMWHDTNDGDMKGIIESLERA